MVLATFECWEGAEFSAIPAGSKAIRQADIEQKKVKEAKKRVDRHQAVVFTASFNKTQVDAFRVRSFFVFSVVEAQNMWLESIPSSPVQALQVSNRTEFLPLPRCMRPELHLKLLAHPSIKP
jgi:hypothetical protein